MLSSIANKLGFGTGVVEQVSIVAADKVSKAVKAGCSKVKSVEYSNKAKEVSKEFNKGRINGKNYIKNNNTQITDVKSLPKLKVQLVQL